MNARDIFRTLTRGTKFKKVQVQSNFRNAKVPGEDPFLASKPGKKEIDGKSSKTLDDLFVSLVNKKKPEKEETKIELELDDDISMGEGLEEYDGPDGSDTEDDPMFEFVNGEVSDGEGASETEDPSKIQLFSGAEPSAEVFQRKQKLKKKKAKKDAKKLAQIKQEEINRFRNQHNIHVQGSDICEPISAFSELVERFHIDKRLMDNIRTMDYQLPTPIQMQAIPLLLEKRDVLASAPTGSGKTAAFLIPVLHALGEAKDVGYRAVVVSPTRELAKQTFFEIERLAAGLGFRVHLLEDVPKVIKKFKAKPNLAMQYDVLVTTPNRLVFLLNCKPTVATLSAVQWLIVDESDKLFEAFKDGGFRDQLAVIYKACSNPSVHRALFSATFATEVEDWCKLNLDNVVMISIGARNAATATIDQKLVFVGNETGKLTALRHIFQQDYTPPVLIFVQTKQKAKELYRELMQDGKHVDVIHSDRNQPERDEVVSNFRAGKVWTLIATEVLGRGIDFKAVNLVINYDFPLTSISYIHRIGRTGRAGQRGKAVTLFTEKDAANLRSIANVMKRSGCQVPDFMLQLKSSSGSGMKKLKRGYSDKKMGKNPKVKGVKSVKTSGIAKKKRSYSAKTGAKNRKK